VRGKITHGNVSVNGTVITDVSFHVDNDDTIMVDGEQINCQTKLYYLFDKPDGVLTAMEDKRLPCVADYIPSELRSKKLLTCRKT
jgi:16S rRNA uridine-516 pseudouridylate synthase and related pseudouridylate synthases